MKVKSTKRSLLVSAILLLVCVSMLVGSTFAWFTDNVSSKNNVIKSGNLDVALYYAATSADVAADKWTEVDASTDIFGYDLWEPGYVKTAYFKVVNKGSLALKYQLSADVYSETSGVNKAGETFLLSDSIKTAVVDADATREEILAMAGSSLKGSIAIDASAQALYPLAEADVNKPNEKVVGLAIWMPTTVGNEANHNGESIPAIEFGVNLLATQLTYEMDSFGKDYDTNAQYPMVAFGSAAVDPAATEYEIPLMKADGGKVGSALILDDSVADDAASISINVVETEDDETVAITADQAIRTFDITVTGLKENNDVPVKVELNVGAGLTGVEVYHRNEKIQTASYNATEGVITFETLSFSPFSVVYDAQAEEEVLDETKPAATVEDVSATYANTELGWTGWGGLNPNNPGQQLEAVFLFEDSHDTDWVANSAYKDWYCDFYVKMDRYVPVNAVVLGGNYGGFGWVGFNNPVEVEAETWVPLLASFLEQTDSGWSYNDIATIVEEFLCGVAHCDSTLDGATFTVQLRLTNPADSSDVIVAAEQSYTFGTAPAYAKTAEELAGALAAGGTVVLADDVTVTSTLTVPAGEEAVINLNGKDLSYAVSNSGASAIINNKGSLELTGEGTISFVAANPDMQEIPGYATNTITNTGTLVIGEGVTVTNGSDGGASYAVDNHGKLTLNGGTLIGNRCALRIAKYNQDNVEFVMNDGLVKAMTPAWIQLPGSDSNAAPKISVTIRDGVFQSTKESSADNDVLYTYSSGNSHANTTVTINGGQFLGGTVSIGSGYKGDVPALTINGGTFEYDVLQWNADGSSTVLRAANK